MSVYFIRDETGLAKIGHSYDPWQRLRALQSTSPVQLAIVRVVDGGQKTEAWLHRRFADYRQHGEWFALTDEMLTIVPPDELPPRPKVRPQSPWRSRGEQFREADRLGLLSERMRRDYAPFLRVDE